MSCDAIMDRVTVCIAQATEPDDTIQAHLATCPACTAEAAELARLWEELGTLPTPPMDPARVSEAVRLGRAVLTHTDRPARPSQRARTPWVTLTFSSMALLVGLLIGYGVRTPERDTRTDDLAAGSPYLLLLHESASSSPDSEEAQAAHVEEHRAWAEQLTEAGQLIGAEKLTDDPGRWLAPETAPPSQPTDLHIGGYFIVRATDYADATRLARSSPHLRHGGSVEIRAIETHAP